MTQISKQSQSQNNEGLNDDSSLFRIMVASDNHLGYLENDQIRGDDSFNTFEEILTLSKSQNVDFLILGGDLFHHHNPSKKTIIRTSNILQKYVYGQKDHKFEVYCYEPNFKNENLSVEVPIFIIHGNHDDPSGFENFSSIDIFSNKEVNYFGKVNNYEKFDLMPILFIKGKTKIALYGIGYIKDERLYLALASKKVNFHRPEDYKSWFNILVVHQNRFKGHNIGKNKKTYLPETFIPNFFDLVIWGHEHECFTTAESSSESGFHIYQPGSSVATSLIQAEANPKHIGLCEINQDKFRIIPIKLETQRPFIYDQFELKQYASQIKEQEDIEHLIEKKVEECLEKVTEGKKQDPKLYNELLPLIRLKIEYTGYTIIKMNSILNKYSSMVANPGDMLQFWRKSELFQFKPNKSNEEIDMSENDDKKEKIEDEMIDMDEELRKFVNEGMSNYFAEKQKRVVLNNDIFGDYLDKAVNGNERHAIEALFNNFYQNAINSMKNIEENDVIKNLQPLENPKKDFSDIFETLIDKEEINHSLTFARGGLSANKNNKSGSGIVINLQSQNNFSNEKGHKIMRQNVSQNYIGKNDLSHKSDSIFDEFEEIRNKPQGNFMDQEEKSENEKDLKNNIDNISLSDDFSGNENEKNSSSHSIISSSIDNKKDLKKVKKKNGNNLAPQKRKRLKKNKSSSSFSEDE